MQVDYLSELNREQYDAVTATDGTVLIIAGAGTGKTKTLTYRTAYLLEKGVAPHSILMLTFTNKAANEMKERIGKLLGRNIVKDVTACTFHSFCCKMLRLYADYIGLNKHFSILTPSDNVKSMDIVKAENMDKYNFKGFPSSQIITKDISMAINTNRAFNDVMQAKKNVYHSEIIVSLVLELKNEWERYKYENSLLNFDDMMLMFLHLLKTQEGIRQELEQRFQYIMVDEYQDTNVLQDKIVSMLRVHNNNLCVVGDDMQSLYSFRGAEVRNILDFPDKHVHCKIVKLENNYRSNQEILDLSNRVCKNATEGFSKHLIGTYRAGKQPIVVKTWNQSDEAGFIEDKIKEYLRQGILPGEICVLSRSSQPLYNLEMLLNRDGIAYKKYGGPKFFDQNHIQDILAYMKIIMNSTDEIAWFRILMVHSGIGEVIGNKLAKACKVHGINHLLDQKYARYKYGKELALLHDELAKLRALPLKEFVIEATRFYIATEKRNIDNMRTSDTKRLEYYAENEKHERDFKDLINMMDDFKSMQDFMDNMALDGNEKEDDDQNSIILSTIHSAKGLEFDVVFVIDCVDMMFPHTEFPVMPEQEKEDNEELRCFYVAITRAKKDLYIGHPSEVRKHGRMIWNTQLSHFLQGCEGLYNVIDGKNSGALRRIG